MSAAAKSPAAKTEPQAALIEQAVGDFAGLAALVCETSFVALATSAGPGCGATFVLELPCGARQP